MMKIKDFLEKTDSRHSDVIDSYAYLIASQMAKLRDEYVLIYIKKKPKYLPDFLYKWIVKKIVVIAEFRN